MRICKYLLFAILPLVLFSSCKAPASTRVYLDENVSWARPTGGLSIDTAIQLHYYKITDYKGDNLSRLVASDSDYIWLQIPFTVPENLKYKSLGFVVPYLHYAEEAYLNGIYIGGYGQFPPHDLSAQYASHFYTLPQDLVNWNNTNIIHLKVLAKGNAAISDGIFIDTYAKAKNKSELIGFFHSKIYMIFEGFIIFAAIYFLIISKGIKEDSKAFKRLAIANFLTVLLLCFFFAAEVPWYQSLNLNGMLLYKIFLCIPLYWILYFIVSFISGFIKEKNYRAVEIIRVASLIICSFITLIIQDFNTFMKICPYILILLLLHGLYAIYIVAKSFFIGEKNNNSVFLLNGFLPLLFGIIYDIVVHYVIKDNNHAYFVLYGWFITILTFIFYSAYKYDNIFQQNQHLTKDLEEEVEKKTVDLTFANARLEQELGTTAKDIDMAAIVQQKFYPSKESFLDGWEFSILFDPMNKISGDLYDYYTDGDVLKGISLFDVSGHGVAASLVAILAKSIIFRAFMRSRATGETVSTTLETINDRILKEKGEVQNYLTGIILRFSNFAEDDSCFVELSSAGHPYPLMYSAKEDKIVTVTHDEYQEQYGAIGIPLTDVSFPNVDLTLYENDILILYTDGLSEAQNEDREEYGVEQVEQILKENHDKSTKEIARIIHEKVIEYIGDAERSDDITFIVLKRVPRVNKE